MDILFILILGHFAGDYALQSDNMANKKGGSSAVLLCHVAVYVLTIWVSFFIYSLLYQSGLFLKIATLIFLLALFIEHWLQDFVKSRYHNDSKQMYYLDQLVHLAVIYIYRIFIY